MKKTDHFQVPRESGIPLSEEEIFEGNTLLLKFMGGKTDYSRKWIINYALFNSSYDELMKVARKINSFWDDELTCINGERFFYKHMMFYQVMDFNYFYRRTVSFVKNYYKWLAEK